MNITRRKALAGMVAASAFVAVPQAVQAAIPRENRELSLTNLHTGERFKGIFAEYNSYQPEALSELSTVLRDHRSGDVHDMDPALFDWMVSLRERLGGGEFHIISGYRSPKTNAAMRKDGRGVAKRSFHMKGQAIDLRMPGIKTSDIRDLARADQLGGVGYYGKSDFVHIDTGRSRFW